MASFSGLAGKVRSITESDEFDLGSISSAYDAGRLITDAFSTPFSDRDEMVRVTFVVGAGKANRQKYDASLQKWIVAALKAIDYEDDKSASCDFDSAGSFKTQHDTGRNLIFVHVFPRCSQKKAAVSHDDETVDEPARLSREHLLVAAEMKTFERTVAKRCPTWSCKKRLQEKLREVRAQFTQIDAKLMNREALNDAEQALYELGSGDDLDVKLKFLQKSLMEMVQNGHLTTAEKTLCLEQMDDRIDSAPNDKAKKRIEENREALSKRSVLDYKPPKIEHTAAIKALQTKLAPLAALEKRGGALLSVAEVSKLGEAPDLEERIATLEEASRLWYETDAELAARLAPLRKHLSDLRRKSAAPKKAASTGGWATVSSQSKRSGGRTASRGKASRSGGAFAALGD